MKSLAILALVIALTGCTNKPATTASPSPTNSSSSVASSPSPLVATPTPTPTPGKSPETSTPEFISETEKKMQELMTQTMDLAVASVNCPGREQAIVGDRFDCEAKAADQTFTVAVEITDTTGNFTWKTRGLVLLSKLEDSIRTSVKQKSGVEVTPDCGGRIRLAKSGDKFECKVSDAQGQSRSAQVTVKDDQGSVEFAL
jgi:hypothetical protein